MLTNKDLEVSTSKVKYSDNKKGKLEELGEVSSRNYIIAIGLFKIGSWYPYTPFSYIDTPLLR